MFLEYSYFYLFEQDKYICKLMLAGKGITYKRMQFPWNMTGYILTAGITIKKKLLKTNNKTWVPAKLAHTKWIFRYRVLKEFYFWHQGDLTDNFVTFGGPAKQLYVQRVVEANSLEWDKMGLTQCFYFVQCILHLQSFQINIMCFFIAIT